MIQSLPLVLAAVLSASPELPSSDQLFSDGPPADVVDSLLAARPESILRGGMPGGGMLESAASGWSVDAGTIVLSRLDPKPLPLVRGFSAGNPVLANTSQFDFDREAGWQLTARRELGEILGVEVRYFQIDGWDASFIARPDAVGAGLAYDGGTSTQGIAGAPVATSLRYSSQLQNLEANLRLRLSDNVVALVGYRHLELHERLTVLHDVAGGPFDAVTVTHDIRASNDLDGVQIGGEVLLLEREFFRLDGYGKAGVFRNEAANKLGYYPNGPGVAAGLTPPTATGLESNVTSFVGEAGITGTLRLTSNISIRAGYLCLWIDEIAEAYNQPFANLPPPGIPGTSGPARHVDASSYQIMQGGQFSIEFAY